jgi:[acyl-carrier-protein] S-malonyltransferase
MHEACEQTKGTMLVITGLDDDQVRQMVKSLNLPLDLWCANFNCPGQVVVSGTLRGIEAAQKAAQAIGAKRTLPLQVHGAFHSELMQSAKLGLEEALNATPFAITPTKVAMNVSGQFADSEATIRSNLIQQVTASVLWHTCVQTCDQQEPSCFLEIGCGKTLAGMNKRIGVRAPTITIETMDDLKPLETLLSQG